MKRILVGWGYFQKENTKPAALLALANRKHYSLNPKPPQTLKPKPLNP